MYLLKEYFKKFLKSVNEHRYAYFILFLLFLIILLGLFIQKKPSTVSKSTSDLDQSPPVSNGYTYPKLDTSTKTGESFNVFKRKTRFLNLSIKADLTKDTAERLSFDAVSYSFIPQSSLQISKSLNLSKLSVPGEGLLRGVYVGSEQDFISLYQSLLSLSSLQFFLKKYDTFYLNSLEGDEFKLTKNKNNAQFVKNSYYLTMNGYYLFYKNGGLVTVSIISPLIGNKTTLNVEIPNFVPKNLSVSQKLSVLPGTYAFAPAGALDENLVSLYVEGSVNPSLKSFAEVPNSATLVYVLDYKEGLIVPVPAKIYNYEGDLSDLLKNKQVIFILQE